MPDVTSTILDKTCDYCHTPLEVISFHYDYRSDNDKIVHQEAASIVLCDCKLNYHKKLYLPGEMTCH